MKPGPTILFFTPWQAVQALVASRPLTSPPAGAAAATTTALGAGVEPTGPLGAGRVVSAPRTGPMMRFCSAMLPCASRANAGSEEWTTGSTAQFFMQATFFTSPLPLAFHIGS
ncbi:hypothetical protein D9M69_561830 [compost metagenome]